jgi:hypothetical protein
MTPLYNNIAQYESLTTNQCLGVVLLISSMSVVGSLICSLIMAPFDSRRINALKEEKDRLVLREGISVETRKQSDPPIILGGEPRSKIKIMDAFTFSFEYKIQLLSNLNI